MTAPDPYADLTLDELVASARAGDSGAFARLHRAQMDLATLGHEATV